MSRVYNFSAGPSMLPLPVLQKAQAELLEYGCSGQSVLEMSHRSSWFEEIIAGTEAALRRVLNVPENYKVGFFQGGASTQFAAVPLNLMGTGSADYIVTGQFSGKAAKLTEHGIGEASEAEHLHTLGPAGAKAAEHGPLAFKGDLFRGEEEQVSGAVFAEGSQQFPDITGFAAACAAIDQMQHGIILSMKKWRGATIRFPKGLSPFGEGLGRGAPTLRSVSELVKSYRLHPAPRAAKQREG